MKLPISVFIITKNEEEHIEKTLKSVSLFDEVILVDSGSTDSTLDIAKRYGAKIYTHSWQGYAKQKQYAMSLCY
jgi:glycosyltransferase involved in cell wall biosynthesis